MAEDRHFHRGGANRAAFIVDIDGVEVGRFTECQGLEVEVEYDTFTEGGVNDFEHKLGGRMSWPNLVLKRSLTVDNKLFEWFHAAAGSTPAGTGKTSRGTMGITIINSMGEPLRTWRVYDAIPVKWTGPSFANSDDEIPTEELEVAHHGFESETFAK